MEDRGALTGLATSPVSHELRRDEDFWFLDGNIVLLVQDTAFRVHRGVLSHHSEVFRDLFAVPQPLNQERIDDCAVVRLHDDPKEVRYLLRVFYGGDCYLTNDGGQIEFCKVGALVKLAHKYHVEDLRKGGLKHSKTYFTDDFDVWNSGKIFDSSVRVADKDYIPTVNLARLVGASELLPLAFYFCCTLPTAELIRGGSRTGAGLSSSD